MSKPSLTKEAHGFYADIGIMKAYMLMAKDSGGRTEFWWWYPSSAKTAEQVLKEAREYMGKDLDGYTDLEIYKGMELTRHE